MKDLDGPVGFAAGGIHQVGDAKQDQATNIIFIRHPGNCPGLPIGRDRAILFHQIGDVARQYVTVAGDQQAA